MPWPDGPVARSLKFSVESIWRRCSFQTSRCGPNNARVPGGCMNGCANNGLDVLRNGPGKASGGPRRPLDSAEQATGQESPCIVARFAYNDFHEVSHSKIPSLSAFYYGTDASARSVVRRGDSVRPRWNGCGVMRCRSRYPRAISLSRSHSVASPGNSAAGLWASARPFSLKKGTILL